MPKPKMNLIGEDGNIFAILGRAQRLLRREGMNNEAHEMFDRVTSGQSYDEALLIISEYVDTELSNVSSQHTKSKGKNSKDER